LRCLVLGLFVGFSDICGFFVWFCLCVFYFFFVFSCLIQRHLCRSTVLLSRTHLAAARGGLGARVQVVLCALRWDRPRVMAMSDHFFKTRRIVFMLLCFGVSVSTPLALFPSAWTRTQRVMAKGSGFARLDRHPDSTTIRLILLLPSRARPASTSIFTSLFFLTCLF